MYSLKKLRLLWLVVFYIDLAVIIITIMAHNGINDINGTAMYGEGNPSELSCVFMEGNNMGLRKGPWTAVEDRILMEYVSKQGEGNWNSVQWNSGLKRCGKSCRLRWANHLRPNLKKVASHPRKRDSFLNSTPNTATNGHAWPLR